ncbi:MAG: nuclear transport factor 2 family protein [Edaphobacter sp.]
MTSIEVVKSFYTTLSSDNGMAALDLVAPLVSWTEMFPGYAGVYTGPEAVRQNLFEPLGQDWEGFVITPESFVVEESKVVAFGTYSGTYKKTGKSIVAPFVHRWEVIDGKITNMRQYTDTTLVEAARG